MSTTLANRIDQYVESGQMPEMVGDECIEVEQELTGMVLIPLDNGIWFERGVFQIAGTNIFIPTVNYPTPTFAGLDIARHGDQTVKVIACECGKVLTQAYAIKMGECVECCLKRMRGFQGRGFMVRARKPVKKMVYGLTDPVKIEEKRTYNREYYRAYRRRRAEGLAA